jgi:hypothetical protein
MGVVSFEELTPEPAEQRAAAYLAALPDKVESLRAQVAASGADPGMLDGTPDSLEPLWRWVVAWSDAGGAELPAELPDWYVPDPPELAGQRLTPATLQLVDRLAAYIAQVVLAEVPDLEWVVVGTRGRRSTQDVHLHQPVLRGSIIDLNPRHVLQVFAIRLTLRGEGRHPTALREAFEVWINHPGIP